MTAYSAAERLQREASPYLQSRANDPIAWWPWCADALDAAQHANKPLLLVIGYSACPWCRQMAEDCFEDADLADAINASFIPILIDKEERPDLNAVYQSAAQGLGLAGGWPLTLFCTPDGLPFWGGTAFAAQDTPEQTGLRSILNHIAEGYTARPDDVRNNASAIKEHLAAQAKTAQPGTLDPQFIDKVAVSYMARMDLEHGGITGTPKFPNTPYFERLWRAYLRVGRSDFAAAIQLTYARMCQGGFFDHVGGGFARYSIDGTWQTPQMEKLLSDNSLILNALCTVHGNIPQALYAQRIAQTVDFLLHDMRLPNGAFAAAQGADAAFYTWNKDDVMAALGDVLGERFCTTYAIDDGSIPSRHAHADFGDAQEEAPFLAATEKLRQVRALRAAPVRDDKTLSDWNGLAIIALVRAAKLMQRPDWLLQAKQAYAAVIGANRKDGVLYHSAFDNRLSAVSTVNDYAAMGLASIALACAEDNPDTLNFARTLADDMLSMFQISNGLFVHGTADPAVPFDPAIEIYDQPIPSGNALAVQFLTQLGQLLGAPRYRNAALEAITALGSTLSNAFMGMSALLNAYEDLIDPIDIHWSPTDFDAETIAWATSPTGALIVGPKMRAAHMPDLVDDVDVGGILICRDNSCGLPESTREGAISALRNARRIAANDVGETLS